jgi:hypothetical protein
MATINQQKIFSIASLGAGGTTVLTWNNYPQHTTVAYFAVPVPSNASGPHGTSTGSVEIERIVVTYQRDNYNGDNRHVAIHLKNPGAAATGVDIWESWVS